MYKPMKKRGQGSGVRGQHFPRPSPHAPRRGLVLVAVLIVVVLLSLAAYNYAEVMTVEYKRSNSAVRYAQAKSSAEAGIHYVAALLAGELQGTTTLLGGNPFDNNQYFRDITLSTNDSPRHTTKFSIVSMHYEDPATGMLSLGTPGSFYGVIDEASKINLNAVMVADTTGNTLYNMLMELPNMTDPIANSIVYWLDPTATERSSGGDNTYYMGQSSGYSAKNGPINTLEELLFVQGVTPQLLYGDDVNRNGIQDNGEQITDGTGTFGNGWSQYLTIYSREPNISKLGVPRININDSTIDLPTLFTNLSAVIDPDLATFIVLARLYGVTATSTASSTGTTTTGGGAASSSTSSASLGSVQLGTLAPSGTMGQSKITSLFQLIGASVTVTPATGTGRSTTYQSPLTDTGSLQTLFPTLWDAATTSSATVLLGRININTANQTILQCICTPGLNTTGAGAAASGATGTPGPGMPILTPTQLQQIMAIQPTFQGGEALDPSFSCPIWLITEGMVPASVMQQLDPYITTYSQVYSFQSVGYFGSGGLGVRFEAVIDLNPAPAAAGSATGGGLICYPRILFQRDISQMMGFESLIPQQQQQ